MARKHDFSFFYHWVYFSNWKTKRFGSGFLNLVLEKFFGDILFWKIFKYLRIFCTFSPFYVPTVQHCQVFRTLNAELLYFWKIHTRLVPFTECNDNFDIRYFKREQQRVLKKVTLEFWMGMPNTLKFFPWNWSNI